MLSLLTLFPCLGIVPSAPPHPHPPTQSPDLSVQSQMCFQTLSHICHPSPPSSTALTASIGQVPNWCPWPQAVPRQSFCHPAYMVTFLKYKSDYITWRQSPTLLAFRVTGFCTICRGLVEEGILMAFPGPGRNVNKGKGTQIGAWKGESRALTGLHTGSTGRTLVNHRCQAPTISSIDM